MGQPFVGEIRMGGWNFAPQGWSFCDGSLIAIDQNSVLFDLIGTTYGGDGVQTFAVPDMRGRLPIHQGTDSFGNPYIIGQISGSENVTVLTNQIPSHNHPLQASSGSASSTNPTGLNFAASGVDVYAPPSAVIATAASSTATGGSQPHTNLMPFLCLTFVISLFGVFPTQN